ncbi:hypothetical protein ACS5PJ_11020 [Pseudarthrobacter sp. YS3]|jgi:hypothetical protein|uniref:hypothetical protein n=1 Tax=Pseudarthrobacter sp. YS3 TaxID=3453718 RepID=UPI003EEFCD9C
MRFTETNAVDMRGLRGGIGPEPAGSRAPGTSLFDIIFPNNKARQFAGLYYPVESCVKWILFLRRPGTAFLGRSWHNID